MYLNFFFNFFTGEFACPLCRQLSNSAVPILPEVGPALIEPLPLGHTELVRYIAEVMIERPITPVSEKTDLIMH